MNIRTDRLIVCVLSALVANTISGFRASDGISGSQGPKFRQELRKFGAWECKVTILWVPGTQIQLVPAHFNHCTNGRPLNLPLCVSVCGLCMQVYLQHMTQTGVYNDEVQNRINSDVDALLSLSARYAETAHNFTPLADNHFTPGMLHNNNINNNNNTTTTATSTTTTTN